MTTTTPLHYSVNLWGSNPELDNDDCWTGDDFATSEEALAAFNHPDQWLDNDPYYFGNDEELWIEIDGPDIYRTREIRPAPAHQDDRSWQREIAMEAGMLHGIDAYNEAMGC